MYYKWSLKVLEYTSNFWEIIIKAHHCASPKRFQSSQVNSSITCCHLLFRFVNHFCKINLNYIVFPRCCTSPLVTFCIPA